jgi:peptide/nickel transport system substrate-binding protein
MDWGVLYDLPAATGAIQPDLAYAWEESPDGMSFTFHLVDNATWTDGVPVTSADVKWSLDWTRTDNRTKFHYRIVTVLHVTSIEAPDDHTIVIHTSERVPSWMRIFAYNSIHNMGIYPKHIYDPMVNGGIDPYDNPQSRAPTVTCGPFIFEEWARGAFLRFKRNPTYHYPRFPFVDEVIVKFIADPATAWTALLANELDAFSYELNPPFATVKLVSQGAYPDLVTYECGSLYAVEITINHQDQYLGDKAVRQAINYAINREEIAEKGYVGLYPAHYQHSQPTFYALPYINPDAVLPGHDPAMAEQILDDAGYPRDPQTGWRFTIELAPFPTTPTRVIMDIVEVQLEAVGINCDYQNYDDITISQKLRDGDFGLISEWSRYGLVPVDDYRENFHIDGFKNWGKFNNAELNQLLDDALLETDPDEIIDMIHRVQEICTEEIAEMPITFDTKYQIMRKGWSGMAQTPDAFGTLNSWFSYRSVFNEMYTQPATVPLEEVVAGLTDDLEALSGRLEQSNEALAASIGSIATALDSLGTALSNSLDALSTQTDALSTQTNALSAAMFTIQILVGLAVIIAIVAIIVPFVRKS